MFARSRNGFGTVAGRGTLLRAGRQGTHTLSHKSFCTLSLALILASGSAQALGAQDVAPVRWKSGQASDARLSFQTVQSELGAAKVERQADWARASKDGGYVLVRFDELPDSAARASLSDRGLEVLSPVGSGVFFARVAGDAEIDALQQVVVDAGPVSADRKLHPRVMSEEMPAWSVIDAGAGAPMQEGQQRVDIAGKNSTVAAYVMFQRDIDAGSPEIEAMVREMGGRLVSVVMSMNSVVVEMPIKALKTMAQDGRVQWVEPPLPPMQTTNDSNRVVTQVNTVNAAPYGLDGTGVTVFVYDGGSVRDSHDDFSGRVTVIDSTSFSFHATHVAGTIGGDGSTINANRGMAPGVNILSAGFEVPGGLGAGFLYTDPGDLEADYSEALSLGASISNNSIGSNVAQNGYDCNWHGDYGITSGVIDNVIRGSLGDQISVFWAAGNERGNGRCGTSYGTTAPPGNNKNSISIGALNSNDDSMTSFSSWGPSDDGRLRPVVSAPGCQSGSDGGVTSTGDGTDTQYITLCGTSMASPTAAGVGALILQDFRVQFPELGEPSNQLMKMLLVQGAEDILNSGPDYQSGYGSIRAQDTIEFMRAGRFVEESVDQGASRSYTIEVDPGQTEFKVTVVWDDPAGAPNVNPALVNDLDLVVVDPSGTRHYPWTLNPESPSAGAVRTQEDHLNNIEQVFVENPQAGLWQVQVVGFEINDGPQSFALGSAQDIGDGLLSLSMGQAALESVLPGTEVDVVVGLQEGADTLVEGSVELSYRFNSGGYSTLTMTDQGDGTYQATIPGAQCGEQIEYFVSATGSQAGVVSVPPAGAGGPVSIAVGEMVVLVSDTFESDAGWTVSGTAGDGGWVRGTPVDCASRGAPGSDSDGSGQCWVSDNDAGNSCNSDIDDGVTVLTSPVYSMPDGGQVSFDYWFADIPTGEVNGDEWAVDGSSDGGTTWTRLRTVSSALQSWRSDTIDVGVEIESSSMMRFRFSASDEGTQNVIEAGLDNLQITQFTCTDPVGCPADINLDGALNFLDVSGFLSAFGEGDVRADLDANGAFNFLDISQFLVLYGQGCP
ncbi:MAG: S8 family serine peptidase [Phycisphaerales bacterium]